MVFPFKLIGALFILNDLAPSSYSQLPTTVHKLSLCVCDLLKKRCVAFDWTIKISTFLLERFSRITGKLLLKSNQSILIASKHVWWIFVCGHFFFLQMAKNVSCFYFSYLFFHAVIYILFSSFKIARITRH